MWALDPANSSDLIDRLRPHGRDANFEVAWVGEGWRTLVTECHERLEAAFPGYELLTIENNHGALDYQASPRRHAHGQKHWTAQEYNELDAISSEIRERSKSICEWCGAAGRVREWRTPELTLCDACDQLFSDPPTQARRA